MENRLSPYVSEGEDPLSLGGEVDIVDDGGRSPAFDENDFQAEKWQDNKVKEIRCDRPYQVSRPNRQNLKY